MATINPDGTHRADQLVPGELYVVAVNHSSLRTNQPGLLTTAYGGWTSITEFILDTPEVTDQDLAKVVAPAAGATTQNIDITMVQGGVVSGTITPANATSPSVTVCELNGSDLGSGFDLGYCSMRSYASIDADGVFQAVVRPGHPVVLYAEANGYSATFLGGLAFQLWPLLNLPTAGVTQVLVSTVGQTRTGLNIKLAGQATIKGKIIPSNAESAEVWIAQIVDNYMVSNDFEPLATDGSYSATVPSGSTVVIYGRAFGFLTTWIGGATGDSFPGLPAARITEIVAPAAGETLRGQDIALVRDGAPVAKPMLRFTLRAGYWTRSPGQILAVDSQGSLWAYSLSNGLKPSAGYRLGTGFSSYQIFGPGDLNGDHWPDILGISSDGKLWLFPGDYYNSLSPKKQVGWGWGAGWRMIPVGDLTGDGQPDLLGIDPKGDLYLYQGKSDGTFPYAKVKVGWGWKNWNLYAAGDLDGDGKVDILGIDSNGDLYQYRGSGKATNPFPYAKQKAGWGWNGGFVMAAGADLNEDGYADIISRQTSTKNLYFYPGLGNAKFGTRTLIDTGW